MKLAIIRVRGIRNIKPKIKKTLELLMLHKPNHCVLFEDSKQLRGMLRIAKDYITFGEVDEDTIFRLLYKRGKRGRYRLSSLLSEEEIREIAKKLANDKDAKVRDFVDPVFTLKPPRKGWKNIKLPYPRGALGFRPLESMKDLIKRMA